MGIYQAPACLLAKPAEMERLSCALDMQNRQHCVHKGSAAVSTVGCVWHARLYGTKQGMLCLLVQLTEREDTAAANWYHVIATPGVYIPMSVVYNCQ